MKVKIKLQIEEEMIFDFCNLRINIYFDLDCENLFIIKMLDHKLSVIFQLSVKTEYIYSKSTHLYSILFQLTPKLHCHLNIILVATQIQWTPL